MRRYDRASVEIRTLRRDEREALLELLDGWPLADGWRGRDFFRRYLEADPTYEDANVFVAAEAGALLSCVQIFPRRLHVAGTSVPAGGIGSVFTRPEARRRGIAEGLVARASQAIPDRGLPVGVLFGGESLYARRGWRNWGVRAGFLVREPDAPAPGDPPGLAVAPFERERDLAEGRGP